VLAIAVDIAVAGVGGDGGEEGDLVDRHGAGVVDVEDDVVAAVGGADGLDPGADLDGLVAAFLLVADLFTPLFAAEQDHGDGEGADGADRGEHVGDRVDPPRVHACPSLPACPWSAGSAEVGGGEVGEVVLDP
jgi:hypothetical protein